MRGDLYGSHTAQTPAAVMTNKNLFFLDPIRAKNIFIRKSSPGSVDYNLSNRIATLPTPTFTGKHVLMCGCVFLGGCVLTDNLNAYYGQVSLKADLTCIKEGW